MATGLQFKNHSRRVIRSVERQAMKRLERAGHAVAAQVRDNISTAGPPHSLPGDYPHTISGELRDNIFIDVDRRGMTVTIGARAEHAEHVERIRPFLSRTLAEMGPEVRRIMEG